MKTCPKCGFRDSECWRNHRWMIYVTYCYIDDLEFWEPELYKEIKLTGPTEKLPLEKGPFIYSLNSSGYIWRMDLEDFKVYGYSRSLTESAKYQERLKLAKAQTRLGGPSP